MWRKIKSYFSFRKAERRALIVLGFLLMVFLSVYYLLDFYHPKTNADFSKLEKLVEAYRQEQQLVVDDSSEGEFPDFVEEELSASKITETHLFRFNPNTATAAEFEELGLKRYVTANIIKYRNKGGSFKIKDDFARIYGLENETFDQLEPYIDLPEKLQQQQALSNLNSKHRAGLPQYKSKAEALKQVDLNIADSATLTTVKGIGPTFSRRIIAYRNRLGGFISKKQLMEVWGIDSTRYPGIEPQVVVNATNIRKLNINTAGIEELRSHPYIQYKVASAIVNYRDQHGPYSDINEIKKIHLISEEQFQNLAPYMVAEMAVSQ